jgi:predicted Zn-dependent protease
VARSVVYDANFDLEKNMLIVKGGDGRAYAPDVKDVQAFHFKKGEEQHAFVAMQVDGANKFVELLAAGRYSLVKEAKVTFHAADFVDKGMVQSGKNYDEYKKTYTYYLVKDNVPVKVMLRKKQFLEALKNDPAAQEAARKFLAGYHEPFDETAARLTIEAVNK